MRPYVFAVIGAIVAAATCAVIGGYQVKQAETRVYRSMLAAVTLAEAQKLEAVRRASRIQETLTVEDAQLQAYYLKSSLDSNLSKFWSEGYAKEHMMRLKCEGK